MTLAIHRPWNTPASWDDPAEVRRYYREKARHYRAQATEDQRAIWRAATRAYRERHKAHLDQNRRGLSQQNQSAIATLKLETGCTDCGYNADPRALDFDHISGDKTRNVSALTKGWSIERALAEIAACEVVCSNCHRIRTANREAERHAG